MMNLQTAFSTLSHHKASKSPLENPPFKFKPAVDLQILSAIDPSALEDSYVYVHCYFDNEWQDMLIRVWGSTYLVDRSSGSRSKLIHIENISFAPQWTVIPDGGTYNFLLIFNALPKSCQLFDLIEEIPQAGGFHVQNIHRNVNDIYHIDID